MSYALDCKEELTHLDVVANQESLTILNAIIRNGFEIILSGFTKFSLKFSTKSNPLIRYIIKLLTVNFNNIKYELYQKQVIRFDKPHLFVIEIKEDSDILIEAFNLLNDDKENKKEIFDNEDLIKAYLRGAFIASGSVNSPKTSNYHLEFRVSSNVEALFIQNLVNYFSLNARMSKIKDKYIIYLKDKDSICDLLRIIGVNVQVFKMEDDIIKRKVIADTKRKVNFDIANQSKTNEASKNMLKYIFYLEKYYPLDKLEPKLKLIMKVRSENQEASLTELCQILEEEYGEKISKSGLNHRLRKIKEIALEYRNKRIEQ